jgi:hypothetical protein
VSVCVCVCVCVCVWGGGVCVWNVHRWKLGSRYQATTREDMTVDSGMCVCVYVEESNKSGYQSKPRL